MIGKTVIAIVALVVVVGVAAGAYIAFSGDDSGNDQMPDTPSVPGGGDADVPTVPEEPDVPDTPTEPDVPSEPETPTDPEEPSTPTEPEEPETPDTPDEPGTPIVPEEPETPEGPETPVDPEEPGISDQTFVLRTEPRVGDTITINVPSEAGFDEPLATLIYEVVAIEGDDLTLSETGTEEEETTTDLITIPAEYFSQGYLLFITSAEPVDLQLEYAGQEVVNTMRGQMLCDHYTSPYIDIWYYPGTDFACMMVLDIKPYEYYVDSTLLSPT